MAYKAHPDFSPPDNPCAKIWRYMDMAKFMSLIDQSALFFPRMDKLDAEDPFEGFFTPMNVTADVFVEYDSGSQPPSKEQILSILRARQDLRRAVHAGRSRTFVNSWHLQEHESAGMWRLYSKSNEGVAIESSYDRLIKSFESYKDFEIHVGMVTYLDYRKELIPTGNLLLPSMHKRKSFEHERELRALIWTPQHGKNSIGPDEINLFEAHGGLVVSVDLNVLISRVFVAPTAQPWVHDLLKSVLVKYGLKCSIERSDLAEKPIY